MPRETGLTPVEQKHYGQLVGRKIVQIVHDGGDACGDVCVGLKLDNEVIAWVMCDPEGNGPGWLDIQKPDRP